ncbi:MAG: hypothetical protein ACMXX9_00690 [Candidatus Woesearchaeota archaeon]
MRYLLLVLLILAACSQPSFSEVNYFQGREGVVASFAQNTPPVTIYEDTPFMLGANVYNRGAFDTNGKVIFEYDTFYFTGSGKIIEEFELLGKQPDYPFGEMGFISDLENLQVRSITGSRETVRTSISVSTCYPYTTILTDFFCIDSDLFGTQRNSVCRSRTMHSYSGQGAPVGITSIEPTVIPRGFISSSQDTARSYLDEDGNLRRIGSEVVEARLMLLQPSFEITIRNLGQGLVFGTDKGLGACTASSDRILGEIKVEAELLGIKLDCTPNPVILRNNQARVRCVVQEDDLFGASSSYQDVLTVWLDYYYLDQTSKQVEIRRN